MLNVVVKESNICCGRMYCGVLNGFFLIFYIYIVGIAI